LDATALLGRLLEALDRAPFKPWNALHFANLLDDSRLLRSRKPKSLCWVSITKTGQSMYFQCADMATALAQCSKQFKRNLRRQAKKLAALGNVTLHLARLDSELDAAYGEFLRLEAAGWKGHDGKASAIALHPRLLGFYGELQTRFAARGDCLIALLKLDDRAIAAQFCLLAAGTLYIQKICYDEAYRAEAPGNQLMHRLLEHCCSEPDIEQLSLVTAPDWAVGRWNPISHDVCEAYVFKPGLRVFGALALRRFKRQVLVPAMARRRRARSAPADTESELSASGA
jgi:CelD/BcsL family acetyltransferase involved in cellulose biosynthesis